MKQGKNPTRNQKKIIASCKRYNPNNWLVVKDLPTELHIINKYARNETSRVVKVILKETVS